MLNKEKLREDALAYHSTEPKGKIGIVTTKPTQTQKDLSLAYTPGVAEPCREIAKDASKAYEYTARGNLVGVLTNGTAVLGLGDIGPLAGKPVMEGKGVLFKRFAGIDVFDIEIDEKDPNKFIDICKAMEPTFGGVNLEDIKAPECFEIETKLKEICAIPIFHDDQHGTAIISGAALLNACELQKKKLDQIKIIFSGAGAAAISCARHYVQLGVCKENIILVDSRGVIYDGRSGINGYKREFSQPANTKIRTLADAFIDADVFVGLSVGGLVSQQMLKSMAPRPIVLAMANPDPEISYPDAIAARDDIIMATGRSDFPNQVNNVLGFPFIFRGALDCRASCINDAMKIAATMALAELAKAGNVPQAILNAYDLPSLDYGPDYIIPKPMDPRVLIYESVAVAKAAMDTGVAQQPINDLAAYATRLERLAYSLGTSSSL
uniref:Malic enzyme n=1 Tax=Aureoumbra lagunensis TaxID=44058 RepID=A0A7S3K636_9STRA